jgi:transcriptional regulator with XRE-family HTH domain
MPAEMTTDTVMELQTAPRRWNSNIAEGSRIGYYRSNGPGDIQDAPMGETTDEPNRTASGSTFGAWLRHWRRLRGLSQLALAGDTEISSRHLSFLETGRSLPSRAMVERLTETLDVPLSDRNIFLLAAGYAPIHAGDAGVAAEYEALERVLEFIIARQTSFPALVIDDYWNIRMRNRIAVDIFSEFRALYQLPKGVSDNAMHLLCHPDGLRKFMPDWADYVEPFIREINHQASVKPDSAAALLRDEIHAYPGIPNTVGEIQRRTGMMDPVLTLRLRMGNRSLSFFTAFTTFVLPSAGSAQTVKIECFYPADPETARHVDAQTESHGTPPA